MLKLEKRRGARARLTKPGSPDTYLCMRTSVDIDDDLLAEAKAVAVRERRSVRSLIEEGLRRVIRPVMAKDRGKGFDLPVSSAGGGVMPGVDFSKHSALLDLMDEEDLMRHGLPRR